MIKTGKGFPRPEYPHRHELNIGKQLSREGDTT